MRKKGARDAFLIQLLDEVFTGPLRRSGLEEAELEEAARRDLVPAVVGFQRHHPSRATHMSR